MFSVYTDKNHLSIVTLLFGLEGLLCNYISVSIKVTYLNRTRTLRAIACAVVMTLTLAVSACGSKKTVEDYYNDPAVKAVFEEEMKAVEEYALPFSHKPVTSYT